jgi:hypothetical protein
MGGTAMAVGGAVTGAVQIGRGFYHTPGTFLEDVCKYINTHENIFILLEIYLYPYCMEIYIYMRIRFVFICIYLYAYDWYTFTYEYTYIHTYIGAVSAISQGKEWDSERKEWIIYDLKQEV